MNSDNIYYYKNKIPVKNAIVVARMDYGEKTNNCIYVELLEYGCCKGILNHNELPKRLKLQKKAISDMKQAGQLICVVTKTPNIDKNGNSEIVELTLKGVDVKYHPNLFERFKNTEKILRLVKFISIKSSIEYDILIKKLHKKIIRPLTELDDYDGVDTLLTKYNYYLRNLEAFLDVLGISKNSPDYDNALSFLKPLIKETNASSTMLFDLFIWKGVLIDINSAESGMYIYPTNILQSLFRHIKKVFLNKTVDIRYIGAPSYKLIIKSISLDVVDELYNEIKNEIFEWFKQNNVKHFEISFQNKELTYGDVSITYPSRIEI